jgi:hypothetical protein
MMSSPRASQLESMSGLTPTGRMYIKALIQEAIAGIPQQSPQSSTCEHCATIQTLSDTVAYLEKRYKEDDKFTLTKAKLLMFIEEHGVK